MHNPIYLAHAGVCDRSFPWIPFSGIPVHAYVYLYRDHILVLRCDQIVKPYSEAWYGGIWTREGAIVSPPSQVPTSVYSPDHFKLVRKVCARADEILASEAA